MISPQLIGNRIEKKRDDIFEIKCNDTTAVVRQKIKKKGDTIAVVP